MTSKKSSFMKKDSQLLSRNEQSDSEQLDQWKLYNNRLNYLQQSMTKIQRKLNKLQANITSIQDSQVDFKDEFRQKLAQMIQVVGSPHESGSMKFSDRNKIEQFKKEIKKVKQVCQIQEERLDCFENKMIEKIEMMEDQNLNKGIKKFIEDKIQVFERRNNKFIQEKMQEVYHTIQELQTTFKQHSKSKPLQIKQNTQQRQQNSILNTSSLLKSTQRASLSKSKQRLSIIPPLNPSDSQQKQRQKFSYTVSKYLQFTAEQKPQSTKINHDSRLSNDQKPSYLVSHTKNNSFSSSSTPTSENNSRVVYLREKLREFQEINKKYEKKQAQYDNSSQLGKQKSISIKKPILSPSSLYNLSSKSSTTSYEYPQQVNFQKSRNFAKQTRRQPSTQKLSFQRQQSASKRYSQSMSLSMSASKGSLTNRQSSAKKIDKLQSIKDYLEQTESEIDDSLLEPNYN